jgi:chromosome segregation ATPase
LLRQTSLAFTNVLDGKEAELVVKRVLKLRDVPKRDSQEYAAFSSATGTSTNSSTFRQGRNSFDSESLDISRIQADLDIQREDIDRIDSAGYQIVNAFDTAVIRIEREVKKLNDTMQDLRREFDLKEVKLRGENRSTLSKLEEQLRTTNTAVSDIRHLSSTGSATTEKLRSETATARTELRMLQSEVLNMRSEININKKATNEQSKEMALFRMELRQLKQEAERDRAKISESKSTSLHTRELDILASNITKIGNRASQVETLQMEVQLLKTRLLRLETNSYDSDSHGLDRGAESHFTDRSTRQDAPSSLTERPRKKRASNHQESSIDNDNASAKRHAFSPSQSDDAGATYDIANEWPHGGSPLSPHAPRSSNDQETQRLTKSGNVDKRSLRRHSKKNTATKSSTSNARARTPED